MRNKTTTDIIWRNVCEINLATYWLDVNMSLVRAMTLLSRCSNPALDIWRMEVHGDFATFELYSDEKTYEKVRLMIENVEV